MTSGNFATAKQALLKSYNVDFSQVQKALACHQDGAAQGAGRLQGPALVRQAAPERHSELHQPAGLLASFATLAKNPKLETDGTTIANWYAGGLRRDLDHGDVDGQPLRSSHRPPRRCPRHRPPCTSRGPRRRRPLDEIAMARGWLQHLRESAIFKVEGLDAAQLRWKPAPAANSLGVLVVHLGYTERLWLRAICAGEQMDMAWRAQMFDLPEGWGADEAVAFYREESRRADAGPGPDHLARPPLPGHLPPDDVPLGCVPPD